MPVSRGRVHARWKMVGAVLLVFIGIAGGSASAHQYPSQTDACDPEFSQEIYQIAETMQHVEVTVLGAPSGGDTCPNFIHWATRNGTAQEPGDYEEELGSAVWTTQDLIISVPIHDDRSFEGNEWFSLYVYKSNAPAACCPSPKRTKVVIVDDDPSGEADQPGLASQGLTPTSNAGDETVSQPRSAGSDRSSKPTAASETIPEGDPPPYPSGDDRATAADQGEPRTASENMRVGMWIAAFALAAEFVYFVTRRLLRREPEQADEA